MLDLSYNSIRSLIDFDGELPKLLKLSLKMNKIQTLKNIDRFPSLAYLKLSRNNLEQLTEVDRLAALKQLRGVSLYKNPLADQKHAYVSAVMTACPQLESLDHNACNDVKKLAERDTDAVSRDRVDDKSKTEEKSPLLSAVTHLRTPVDHSTKNKKTLSAAGVTAATTVSKMMAGSEAPEFQNQKIAMVRGFVSDERSAGLRQTSLEKSSLEKKDSRDHREPRETEYKFDEAMDEDDDDKEAASPQADDNEDIFAMNPKSLVTVKLAWDRRVRDKGVLFGSSGRKDEEVWLGTPTHPIGYFKRVSGNNYKVVGDGLWMLMAAKTVAIKSIDEVGLAD